MAKEKGLTEADVQVIQAMAQCDMDSTKAAAMLHYHVGSVKYHIKRIREKTGLNPRGFFDLCKLLEMEKK